MIVTVAWLLLVLSADGDPLIYAGSFVRQSDCLIAAKLHGSEWSCNPVRIRFDEGISMEPGTSALD